MGEHPVASGDIQGKTVGDIAQLLRQPKHKIRYVIRSRRIKPKARVGPFRLFDADAIARIRAGLATCRRTRTGSKTAR